MLFIDAALPTVTVSSGDFFGVILAAPFITPLLETGGDFSVFLLILRATRHP
jgi:hypothetical protein